MKNGTLAFLFLAGGALYLFISAADISSPDYLFGYWRLRHIALAGVLFVLSLACLLAMLGRSAALAFWASFIPAILFLGAVETVGRVGLVNWENLLHGSSDGGGGPGWELVPDVSVEGETYQDIAVRFGVPHEPMPFRFETDSLGFRNADTAESQIIILGDSIVLGAQVAQEALVDRVVGETLGVPTAQAALLGLAIQQQHDMLLDSGLALDGKLVVQFLFEGNDLIDSRTYRTLADAADSPPSDSGGSSLLGILWSRLVKLSNPPAQYSSCEIGDQQYLFLWLQNSFAGLMDEVAPITESISVFRDRIEGMGADYALVFVPTKYRVLYEHCAFPPASLIAEPSEQLSDLPQEMRAWAETSGVRFLDLTEALKSAADDGEYSWFWGDTHWSAGGHGVAGQALASWLR